MQRHDRRVPVSFYSRYTRDIAAFADAHTGGKVVSVLEGGYGDRALTSASLGHAIGLMGRDADPGWWSVDELILLERAVKKRRKGKLCALSPDLAQYPHIARAHSILANWEGAGPVTPAPSAVQSAAATPNQRMTLRERRPKAEAEDSPRPAPRRRKPASAAATPAKEGEVKMERETSPTPATLPTSATEESPAEMYPSPVSAASPDDGKDAQDAQDEGSSTSTLKPTPILLRIPARTPPPSDDGLAMPPPASVPRRPEPERETESQEKTGRQLPVGSQPLPNPPFAQPGVPDHVQSQAQPQQPQRSQQPPPQQQQQQQQQPPQQPPQPQEQRREQLPQFQPTTFRPTAPTAPVLPPPPLAPHLPSQLPQAPAQRSSSGTLRVLSPPMPQFYQQPQAFHPQQAHPAGAYPPASPQFYHPPQGHQPAQAYTPQFYHPQQQALPPTPFTPNPHSHHPPPPQSSHDPSAHTSSAGQLYPSLPGVSNGPQASQLGQPSTSGAMSSSKAGTPSTPTPTLTPTPATQGVNGSTDATDTARVSGTAAHT